MNTISVRGKSTQVERMSDCSWNLSQSFETGDRNNDVVLATYR